jgi:Plavaka transposase
MAGACITDLMQIWAASLDHDVDPPFADKDDLYDTIDATSVGDVPWQSFTVSYTGDLGDGEVAPWKVASYDVWYRDPRDVLKGQLANPDFAKEMDFAPKEIRDAKTGRRRFQNFMSGHFSWRKAVCPFMTVAYQKRPKCQNCRIKLPKMKQIMAQLYVRSYWEVTRQRYQLRQVIMSIIHSICPMASFITMSDVRTVHQENSKFFFEAFSYF